jgi:hypothetical protein
MCHFIMRIVTLVPLPLCAEQPFFAKKKLPQKMPIVPKPSQSGEKEQQKLEEKAPNANVLPIPTAQTATILSFDDSGIMCGD